MEDRCSERLWLVPSNDPASQIGIDSLGGGVNVVHHFENQVPGRTDLPRTLDEFTHLTIAEVGDSFVAPTSVGSAEPMLFERTARPGQGTINGRPTLGISLVLIAPREPSQAQALRDWADFVHIHHIAQTAVPGITMITPYRNLSGDDPMFMHLYEMDSDDPEAVFQSMTPMVTQRIGAPDTPEWKAWAMCPELVISYVNSFRKPDQSAS